MALPSWDEAMDEAFAAGAVAVRYVEREPPTERPVDAPAEWVAPPRRAVCYCESSTPIAGWYPDGDLYYRDVAPDSPPFCPPGEGRRAPPKAP